MKILCISKKGKLEKYVTDPGFYSQHEVEYVSIDASDDEILAAGKDADIIIVDAITKVSGYVIEHMPKLKMIHSEGVAYNWIDIETAKKQKVYVCNCKGMNATAVAEQTILLMIGVLRDVILGDRATRQGEQIKIKTEYMVQGSLKEIADCTIGFVGFGDIAKETARIIEVLGGKIRYYKRHRLSPEEEARYHAEYMPLKELLAECDMISLSTPVTPETIHMANKDFFENMKEGAYLINAGRGELVDTEALLEAIRSGHLAGAGMDTIEGEPVQADNPMLTAEKEVMDKLVFSPHIGGITSSSFKRGFQMIVSDIEKISRGEEPDHIVNRWKKRG